MLLNEAIKIRLQNLIEEHKTSKYQVSCGAGLHHSSLNKFYKKRISYPRLDTLYLICASLGITLEQFFNDSLFLPENIEIEKDNK